MLCYVNISVTISMTDIIQFHSKKWPLVLIKYLSKVFSFFILTKGIFCNKYECINIWALHTRHQEKGTKGVIEILLTSRYTTINKKDKMPRLRDHWVLLNSQIGAKSVVYLCCSVSAQWTVPYKLKQVPFGNEYRLQETVDKLIVTVECVNATKHTAKPPKIMQTKCWK